MSVTRLVPFMREFQASYPGVDVALRDTAEENIREALIAEDANIGIGTFLGTAIGNYGNRSV